MSHLHPRQHSEIFNSVINVAQLQMTHYARSTESFLSLATWEFKLTTSGSRGVCSTSELQPLPKQWPCYFQRLAWLNFYESFVWRWILGRKVLLLLSCQMHFKTIRIHFWSAHLISNQNFAKKNLHKKKFSCHFFSFLHCNKNV